MRNPNKLLGTLAGIAAALLVIFLGIKLFDGRSPQAVFVQEVIGFRALDVRLHVGEKMDHVYPLLPTPEGKAARKEIAEILSGK